MGPSGGNGTDRDGGSSHCISGASMVSVMDSQGCRAILPNQKRELIRWLQRDSDSRVQKSSGPYSGSMERLYEEQCTQCGLYVSLFPVPLFLLLLWSFLPFYRTGSRLH